MQCVSTVNEKCRLEFNGKPYGPRFADVADAEAFMQFVVERTGMDPRQQTDFWLRSTAEKWVKS